MTLKLLFVSFSALLASALSAQDQHVDTNQCRRWSFHTQATFVAQGDPAFPAKYSGFNSLNSNGEVQKTVTADLFAGVRLWRGAEAHADLLMWQGFGLSQTYGIEDFPNGDAYKAGTQSPNFQLAHLFIRQTIGLGGEQENVSDDQLKLAGKQDISRLTFTIGEMSPLDISDGNIYAKDPHTQFMNWATMVNITWDYGQNTVGYTTGLLVELNQPKWSLRYGFFQMPRYKNGFTGDDQLLMYPARGEYGPFFRSWAMNIELERRYSIHKHPGVIRFQAWLDEANFASYKLATAMLLANPPSPTLGPGAGITIPNTARSYQLKPGLGLNWEQELSKNAGIFSRLGWTPGQLDTWTLSDPDWSASLGASIKGEAWHRHNDTYGLVVIVSGASKANQNFLKAGGTDMLSGDGNLNYGPEQVLETYYDFKIWKTIHTTLDYQYVVNPALNRDRGPVSIFGARLHLEF